MRREYSRAPEVQYKGGGWGDQERKWEKEDKELKKLKKKVCDLKDSGEIPQSEVINIDDAKKL